jgi:AbiV family abortive infection protein
MVSSLTLLFRQCRWSTSSSSLVLLVGYALGVSDPSESGVMMNSSDSRRHVPDGATEYRGPLTPSQAARGINAAKRNGKNLASDARLLLDNGRYSTSVSLAALSIEESGKSGIIRAIVLESDPVELKKQWKRFRHHRSKNAAWILPELVTSGATKLSQLASAVDADAIHTKELHDLKMVGLYADCHGSAHWSEPSEVFSNDLSSVAMSMVERAELLASFDLVTEREMELWVQHLGPHWRTENMRKGLIAFYKALNEEGLSEHDPESVLRFFT